MENAIKALRDITTKSENKPPNGLLNKILPKSIQTPATVLPYILNARETRVREDFSRNNKLNISMEGGPGNKIGDCNPNRSFDTVITKTEGFSVLNGLNYPKRTGFTKKLLLIHKDKTVFSSSRPGEKVINNDEEEKILIRKLEETKMKKEAIIKMMAENEKKNKDREAFIEKVKKLRNQSAKKIQLRWRIYKSQKAFKEMLERKRIQSLKKITEKCKELILHLNCTLVQENSKLEKNIKIIQNNVRKFLAKNKLKILWRRKISNFFSNKLCAVIENSQIKTGFKCLKEYGSVKIDKNTFFITGNPTINYTPPTQDSDFDDLGKNIKNFGRGRITASPAKSNNQNMKKHLDIKKSESIISLGNTSISSMQSFPDPKTEQTQISKTRPNKCCFGTKNSLPVNIGIREAINLEDKSTTRRISKTDRTMAENSVISSAKGAPS